MQLTERWQRIHLAMAKTLAKEASKDASTQVGAVVVNGKDFISFGYNGFPSGIDDDPDILQNKARRDEKLALMVHAEANALDRALRPLVGASMVVTRHPCSQCAKRIANTDIQTIYYEIDEDFETRWADDLKIARMIFEKKGISIYGIRD